VTGNCRPEAEQLVASADGAKEAQSNLAQGGRGWHPARGLEVSAVSSGADDAATTPLIDNPQLPSAARMGARSIPGFRAAGGQCTAVYSGELGLRGT
jgi:hypothetical protein